MHNYRKFKDYHIERLRDPEDAKIYLSVALEDYKEDKDKGAFLLAVDDVREAQGDNFLEKVDIFKEVSAALTTEGLAALPAGGIGGIDNTPETSPIDRFFQWCRQTVLYLFTSPLAVGTVGVGTFVLVIGSFYLGEFFFIGNAPKETKSKMPQLLIPESPVNVEPTLVKGRHKVVKVSPFGFGAFPKIPADFPDQDIWNKVEKRSIFDLNGAKTLELLARVRIELWNQGKHTKGVIMDPSSGLIYSDSNINVLFPNSPDLPKYDTYFDEGFSPLGGIVVFLEGGIDPYEFLKLPQ